MRPRILIAGIGNIFLGDDGFGVEVAQRMATRSLPSGVLVKDLGIRGVDLAYALMEAYELTILVDACQQGGSPGTIYVIEPDPIDAQTLDRNRARMEAHGMTPMNALHVVKSIDGKVGRIAIVGCEPEDLGSEEGKLGLSDTVAAAVDEAILVIEKLVTKTLQREPEKAAGHSDRKGEAMATESDRSGNQHANDTTNETANETRDTMYLLGGAALVLFGAGLILSTPVVKRALGGMGVGNLVGAALPDLERYLKLRAM